MCEIHLTPETEMLLPPWLRRFLCTLYTCTETTPGHSQRFSLSRTGDGAQWIHQWQEQPPYERETMITAKQTVNAELLLNSASDGSVIIALAAT